MNTLFSNETLLKFKKLKLKVMDDSSLDVPYGEHTWFQSSRTDYEQFKADVLKSVQKYEPDDWEPSSDDDSERLELENGFAYYEITVYNEPNGIQVSVAPFD